MSDIENKIAKDIFIKYGGSYRKMDEEGEYETYKSFNISDDQERIWIKEYQKEIVSKLNSEKDFFHFFYNFCKTICHYEDKNSFNQMLEIVETNNSILDSFTKVLIAEEIYDVIKTYKDDKIKLGKLEFEAQQLVLNMMDNVIKNPITVAQKYKDEVIFKDSIKDDKIIKRAKDILKKINKT